MGMESEIIVMVAALLAIASFSDLHFSKIPNWLTFSGAAIALSFHAWTSGVQGLLFSLAGLGAGLGLFLILYVSDGVGAGDVKLMASIGAMVGPYGALLCGLLAVMVGGGYALVAMCYHWGLYGTVQNLLRAAQGLLLIGKHSWSQELKLPFHLRYGLAISGGTLLFLTGFHPFGG
jgi:prepilin peptidase CpaA